MPVQQIELLPGLLGLPGLFTLPFLPVLPRFIVCRAGPGALPLLFCRCPCLARTPSRLFLFVPLFLLERCSTDFAEAAILTFLCPHFLPAVVVPFWFHGGRSFHPCFPFDVDATTPGGGFGSCKQASLVCLAACVPSSPFAPSFVCAPFSRSPSQVAFPPDRFRLSGAPLPLFRTPSGPVSCCALCFRFLFVFLPRL